MRIPRILSAAVAAAAMALSLTAVSAPSAQAAFQRVPPEGARIQNIHGEWSTFTVQMSECGVISASPATRGSCVTSLQLMLRLFGYTNVRATSVVDAETDAAIRAYQRWVGLSPDGRVGQATRARLLRTYMAAWETFNPPRTGYQYHRSHRVAGANRGAEEMFQRFLGDWKNVWPNPPVGNNCPARLEVGVRCDLATGGLGNIEIVAIGSRHLQIRSLPGHVEGAGRDITFTFDKYEGQGVDLNIHAWGPVGPTLATQGQRYANEVGVVTPMWQRLGDNIRTRLS